ncbi:hypothetical protein [Anatilimnocola floriformis]|uniref:hypothetical protein n=1 Tax=Anatilimnocola floriformis TaxID=2948575 RepID=UPI0020C56EBB|nr:hypothetical protein [Anatilimnocola floriformis]
MKSLFLVPLILLAALGPRSAVAEGDAVEGAEVSKIEQECLTYRRAIKSGHVLLDVVHHYRDEGGGTIDSPSSFEIFFEPEKLRFDQRVDGDLQGAIPHQYRCIITPIEVISRRVFFFQPVAKVGVTIRDTPLKNSELNVFDPRLLGLAPCSVQSLERLDFDSCIGQKQRKETKVSHDKLKGQDCTVVEYIVAYSPRTRIYFRGADARYVLRIESGGEKGMLDRIDCEYAEPREGEIAFPRKIEFARHYDGNPVYEVTHTVKSAMSLPPGTSIHRPQGPITEWDGSEEVTLRQKTP